MTLTATSTLAPAGSTLAGSTLAGSTLDGEQRLRVAVLAPPWIPVPPPGYGGIELVVSLLCEGLVRGGHDVTLFAAPGSSSSARVVEVLPRCYPDEIERALHEVDHVARVFAAMDEARAAGAPFDVLHDHCGFTAVAMADRVDVPVVHTLHGPFTEETSRFYNAHGARADLVAISRAQQSSAPLGLPIAGVVPNPVDVRGWPFRSRKEDYLLWVGRFSPEKGAHRAIAVASAAGVPLLLAGPVQPGQEEYFNDVVAPNLDGCRVRYVGEVGGQRKQALFAGARALLMPIRWPEPFGMVMVEALATGTPVIAFPEGAAREIVQDGNNGFLVADEDAMVAAVSDLHRIDPAACRASVARRYDVDIVAAEYYAIYRRADARHRARDVGASPGLHAPLRPPSAYRAEPATGGARMTTDNRARTAALASRPASAAGTARTTRAPSTAAASTPDAGTVRTGAPAMSTSAAPAAPSVTGAASTSTVSPARSRATAPGSATRTGAATTPSP